MLQSTPDPWSACIFPITHEMLEAVARLNMEFSGVVQWRCACDPGLEKKRKKKMAEQIKASACGVEDRHFTISKIVGPRTSPRCLIGAMRAGLSARQGPRLRVCVRPLSFSFPASPFSAAPELRFEIRKARLSLPGRNASGN